MTQIPLLIRKLLGNGFEFHYSIKSNGKWIRIPLLINKITSNANDNALFTTLDRTSPIIHCVTLYTSLPSRCQQTDLLSVKNVAMKASLKAEKYFKCVLPKVITSAEELPRM